MAQHDYNIANQSGAAFRADLNNALLAIVSQNSGTSAPSTTFAHQLWADTTTGILKIRNAANSAWIELMQLDGTLTMEDGTALLPGLAFRDDLNTGLFSDAADTLGITTNGVERVEFGTSEVVFNDGGNDVDFRIEGDTNANLFFVDAGNDRVGIGTSSPAQLLHVQGSGAAIRIDNSDAGANVYGDLINSVGGTTTLRARGGSSTHGSISLNTWDGTNDLSRLFISSSGNVGIGTTSPTFGAIDHGVHISGSGAQEGIRLQTSDGSGGILEIYAENGGNTLDTRGSGYIRFNNAATEWGRWDSSGRLLVGTSTALSNVKVTSVAGNTPTVQLQGQNDSYSTSFSITNSSGSSYGPAVALNASRGSQASPAIVLNNGDLGFLTFNGYDGTNYIPGAHIAALVDGTPGSNDMPGRLVFSTTADGASSPTERMRITNEGYVTSKSSNIGSITGTGWSLNSATGELVLTKANATPLYINRTGDDGSLIAFYQDGALEGSIEVSGSTVSLSGGHLSRWSQLPGGVERTEILRGSVLSNIDEMCEWGEEDNEQLNRMKLSDVEGDKNVSGVFQAWDDDDDTYTNDFYCAMTGDFVIRIGAGVTVERGDLLMSAGDGTAKPQDDDIIRSKTIAKVTSTNVSCTYDDGSYCVPCVLMAC